MTNQSGERCDYHGQPHLILVAEDNIWCAVMLETILIDAGYEVLGPAMCVKEALDLLDQRRPDAAVLDVDLGGEWVTPVAQALVSEKIPFVLASAHGPMDLAIEPVLSKAVNLGKPTAAADLLTNLDRMVTH